jgi:hypothetical protein
MFNELVVTAWLGETKDSEGISPDLDIYPHPRHLELTLALSGLLDHEWSNADGVQIHLNAMQSGWAGVQRRGQKGWSGSGSARRIVERR